MQLILWLPSIISCTDTFLSNFFFYNNGILPVYILSYIFSGYTILINVTELECVMYVHINTLQHRWRDLVYCSERVLCIWIITFWNFTIITCGLSCSPFWSVLFHCGFGKPVQILHCCLVFQRFVVNFLECTCLCYSGWHC